MFASSFSPVSCRCLLYLFHRLYVLCAIYPKCVVWQDINNLKMRLRVRPSPLQWFHCGDLRMLIQRPISAALFTSPAFPRPLRILFALTPKRRRQPKFIAPLGHSSVHSGTFACSPAQPLVQKTTPTKQPKHARKRKRRRNGRAYRNESQLRLANLDVDRAVCQKKKERDKLVTT